MKKAEIVIHQNYLEQVIKKLHEIGIMEIIDISKQIRDTKEKIELAESHPDAETLANYEIRLARLVDILKKYKQKKKGIKSLFHPDLPEQKEVEEKTLEELYSYAEGTLGDIEQKIIQKKEKIDSLKEEKEEIEKKLDQINFLKDFDFNIGEFGENKYLILKAGITEDIKPIEKEIEKLTLVECYKKGHKIGKKIKWAVVLIGHIKEKEKIEKITRENIEEFKLNGLSGFPKEVNKELNEKIKDINKEGKNIKKDLRKYTNKQLSELLSIKEEIKLEKIRKEVPKNFTKTNYTYQIEGWVKKEDQNILKNSLNNVAKEKIVINLKTPSQNPDNPPVDIKTPWWAKGFKDLLGMFSLPKYNEINPTVIMGIFFVLFFGFMLGDGGYGLVILSLSLFGYFKFSKFSSMIKSWSFMGIWLGLTTAIVGFLTNSFFGDLIPRFIYNNPEQTLYQANIMGISLPLNSIKDPLTILTIALILGLIHLNIGIILGILQEYRNKNYKKLLTEQSCWIPLQIGGGMLIGKYILDFQLSQSMFYIAAIIVVIGIIQLFAGKGPIGFFDITGYVGDWLSYARLLALGLATAGMALAFNVVSGMLRPEEGGIIAAVLIIIMVILLIIMHLVNLGLQALGAGVHSLRLQYVEFFNRFYEGGGKEFSPFKIKRRYTKKIKEK